MQGKPESCPCFSSSSITILTCNIEIISSHYLHISVMAKQFIHQNRQKWKWKGFRISWPSLLFAMLLFIVPSFFQLILYLTETIMRYLEIVDGVLDPFTQLRVSLPSFESWSQRVDETVAILCYFTAFSMYLDANIHWNRFKRGGDWCLTWVAKRKYKNIIYFMNFASFFV